MTFNSLNLFKILIFFKLSNIFLFCNTDIEIIFLKKKCNYFSIKVLEGAISEISNKVKYNKKMLKKYYPPFFKKGVKQKKSVYPNGDVNPKEGVCTDLIVRALRNAKYDLQKKLHEDILNNKKYYGIKNPDKYIDHRRVWILLKYFRKNHKNVYNKKNVKWMPGDIVIWDTGSKEHLHIGILSKKKNRKNQPIPIHNMMYVPFVFKGKTAYQNVIYGPFLLRLVGRKWKVLGIFRVFSSDQK